MSNLFRHNLNKIVTLLLKTAATVYLLGVVFPYLSDPGFQNNVGNWMLRWGLIAGISAVTLLFFVLKRDDFLLYGFFIVFFASVFQFFVTIIDKTPLPGALFHIYVGITSIYFVTKDLRRTQSGSHHSGKRRKSSAQE
ncbi:hypothetical protein MASR2M12_23550 [Bacteroidales bacterium]